MNKIYVAVALIVLAAALVFVSCSINIYEPTTQADSTDNALKSTTTEPTAESTEPAIPEPTTVEPTTEPTTIETTTKAPTTTTQAPTEPPINPKIGVTLQRYDKDNIAEILGIYYDGKQTNPEIDAINRAIKTELKDLYDDFMSNYYEEDFSSIDIKSYPFTSDEYLQIVSTYAVSPSYSEGHMKSYNYSKKEDRYITLADAMKHLGLTKDIIERKAKELYVPYAPDNPNEFVEEEFIYKAEPVGFLIRQGEQGPYTTFLLEVSINSVYVSYMEPMLYAYIPQTNKLYYLNSCLFDPSEMDQSVYNMERPLSYMQ